jgi:hypothetical protein
MTLQSDRQQTIESAVLLGMETYVAARKAKVPEFVARHFSFGGALYLHRKTFGKDFYKHPLNLLWGLPLALAKGAAGLLDKAGSKRAAAWLNRIPAGIPTALEKNLEWLLYTELLELPYERDGRISRHDALMEAILAQPEIVAMCEEYLCELHSHADRPEFRAALERNLAEYGKTRAAVSELAGSLLNLAAGYAAVHQVTPGALSAGTAAATAIAQQIAISNFWLGPTLGAWYYAVFPASASAGLIAAATGALMAAVGVLAALSWIVVDPLLAKTGFHQKRLEGFVAALGDELRGQKRGDYRIRDHYVARVFDVLDILRAAAKAVS